MMVTYAGTYPASSSANGYFAVAGNASFLPFASSLVGTVGNINTVLAPTGYNGEVYNTVKPAGWKTIIGTTQPYFSYRTLSATIKVECFPLNVQDSILVNVCTVLPNQNAPTTIWTATSAPNSSKTQMFSVYKRERPVTLSKRTSEVYGVTESAVKDDLAFTALYNASPSNEWVFVINFQQINNAVTAAVAGIHIEVEYTIEFLANATGDLPDTLESPGVIHDISQSQDIIKIGGKTYAAV